MRLHVEFTEIFFAAPTCSVPSFGKCWDFWATKELQHATESWLPQFCCWIETPEKAHCNRPLSRNKAFFVSWRVCIERLLIGVGVCHVIEVVRFPRQPVHSSSLRHQRSREEVKAAVFMALQFGWDELRMTCDRTVIKQQSNAKFSARNSRTCQASNF